MDVSNEAVFGSILLLLKLHTHTMKKLSHEVVGVAFTCCWTPLFTGCHISFRRKHISCKAVHSENAIEK